MSKSALPQRQAKYPYPSKRHKQTEYGSQDMSHSGPHECLSPPLLVLSRLQWHSEPSEADAKAMEEFVIPPGSIDLDVLDEYLMSDHAPDDCMGLSDLDGFLTGIVVGPELILPSEWLPVIWGGEQPKFETEDEMRMVLGTIMGRYNQIVTYFNANAEEFDPIFWEGPKGEVIASDWAGGFLDAVALRADAWKSLLEDDDVGMLMVPLLVLNGDLELDYNEHDEDEFLAEAPDIIRMCVAGIQEFWKRHHRRPARSADRRRKGGRCG